MSAYGGFVLDGSGRLLDRDLGKAWATHRSPMSANGVADPPMSCNKDGHGRNRSSMNFMSGCSIPDDSSRRNPDWQTPSAVP